MKFCPSCEAKLKKNSSTLTCPRCDYVSEDGKEADSAVAAITIDIPYTATPHNSEFNVLEQKDTKDDDGFMPAIEIECEKCGNNKAVWWMLQTRSADEPTTQFYRCTQCKYTWRNYA